MKTNDNNALVTFEMPKTLAECTTSTFRKIGITGLLKSPDEARVKLVKEGVTLSLSDNAAILVKGVTDSVNSAEKSKNNAALALGVMSYYKVWETTPDGKGKPYGEKGMGRFLQDVFPNFSPKTMISYMTAGRNVYLPIEMGNPDYEGLEQLATLPISVTKEIASVINDYDTKTETGETYGDNTKDLILDLIKEKGDKPLTSRELAEVRRKVKGESKKSKGDSAGNTTTTAETVSQLEGGATERTINRIFVTSVTDGELSLTIQNVPGNDKDTVTGLFKAAANDATKAKLLALAMYNLLVKAMPANEIEE